VSKLVDAGIKTGVGMAPILPGISDRSDQLREVVMAAREAGATGVWTNLLFLRPGTREHFLQHLAEDWPELEPRYRELYRGRAYLGAEDVKPVKRRVSALARELGVADRRVRPVEPEAEPEQLALAV
jgi:DNA repair photolyase